MPVLQRLMPHFEPPKDIDADSGFVNWRKQHFTQPAATGVDRRFDILTFAFDEAPRTLLNVREIVRNPEGVTVGQVVDALAKHSERRYARVLWASPRSKVFFMFWAAESKAEGAMVMCNPQEEAKSG